MMTNEIRLEDTLHRYISGANLSGAPGNHRLRKSSLVLEEEGTSSIEITGAGASMALGMMYLKSNNERIATMLSPPETVFEMGNQRPHHLLIRTLCKSLVMWKFIRPHSSWIYQQLPSAIRHILPIPGGSTTPHSSDFALPLDPDEEIMDLGIFSYEFSNSSY